MIEMEHNDEDAIPAHPPRLVKTITIEDWRNACEILINDSNADQVFVRSDGAWKFILRRDRGKIFIEETQKWGSNNEMLYSSIHYNCLDFYFPIGDVLENRQRET